MNEPQGFFPRFGNLLFDHRKLVLLAVMLVTAWFAWHIPAVRMLSDFADLLPQQHPYIKLHNSIRDTFGGANIITMAVEVEEGTIFTNETLSRIHRITEGMDQLTSINHNLVTSLTHRNTRKISLTPDGNIRSVTYYDPQHGDYSPDELAGMQRDVVASPRVFGLLVSPDLKAAIIKGTLNEGALDYGRIFEELQAIRAEEAAPGVRIHATGNPVLVGWVDSYSAQILQIFLYTVFIVLAILIVYTRRLYGILLPLLGMALTSIWGVGFMGVLGYNLDPLMLVVPFLISARALSHGIQKVERYFLELARTDDKQIAARNTFNALFRPGALAIVADAAALFLIGLGSVPINDKMAVYASFWAVSMLVTVLVTLPMLLAILPKPKNIIARRTFIRDAFPRLATVVGTPARARAVLWVTLCVVLVATVLSFRVQIGEPEPGSPLLYRDHDFNLSSKAINDRFPGSEELFIIARTDEKGGLKRPEVIKALADGKTYMLLEPTMGGAKGLNNLVIQVNQ
ncbi:MAG: MMPL family transporter, partial [Gammaproteobacteria bacterium]|nr:MMPL family transporter [Gammaproteobacteria bacterium]